MNLANIPSLVPVPIPSYMNTPAANPVAPLNQRQAGIAVYDPNVRTPYVQNMTMSLTRNIGSSLTVDVRYIGTLSRKQMSSVNLNSVNMYAKTGGKTSVRSALEQCARGEESG